MVCMARRQACRINEVVSSNSATIADENGDYSDWIELANEGTTALDLTGWGLSDQPELPFKWVFTRALRSRPGDI